MMDEQRFRIGFPCFSGVPVIPDRMVPETQENVVLRPWWQRWMGLVWRPWRKPLVVKSMPYIILDDGAIYLHPDNLKRLADMLERQEDSDERD